MSRISMSLFGWLGILVLPLQAGAAVPAAGSSTEFFEKRIRPVLAQDCYDCHSATAARLKAGLAVDHRDALLEGGDSGPALVPGKPEQSLLIKALRHTDENLKMPPNEKLADNVIADFVQWIKDGAAWPAEAAKAPARPYAEQYDELRRTHWAYQPIRAPAVPTETNAAWPRSDIDRFLLAALEAKGLKPAGPADRTTLIRRLSFDLTGLPPSPAEIDAFVADKSGTAVENVVDRLLASPTFGERWGRHWLDVARYAQSSGMTRNFAYPWAWRYRDWVIDAFNADMPYNRFLAAQIAGDLLPAATATDKGSLTVATGFLALGPRDLNQRNRLQYLMDNIDEQIDVVSKAFLGTTVACARCHDHKFDPIPQTDYYALAGIFRSTTTLVGYTPAAGAANRFDETLLLKVTLPGRTPTPAEGQRLEKLEKELAAAEERLAALQSQLPAQAARAGGAGAGAGANRTPLLAGRGAAQLNPATPTLDLLPIPQQVALAQQNIARLKADIAALQPAAASEATVMGVRDEPRPVDARLYQRGEVDKPGQTVPRGFPHLFPSTARPPGQRASGRLELADWLNAPDNPLTRRVIVNRIWHHLFGAGLVRTVDNFGLSGEAPSHPELLDHLATRFAAEGWSLKRLIRQIVLSRAYQMDTRTTEAGMKADPDNRLLWRMSPRRLEAECLRDAMMAVAGTLSAGRDAVDPSAALEPLEIRGTLLLGNQRDSFRRALYLPVYRNLLPSLLDVFDFADPSMVMGQRENTTVATQALYFMNDPFVLQQARAFAVRLLGTEMTDDQRIDAAYRLALGRLPTAGERKLAAEFLLDMAPPAAPGPRGNIAPAMLRQSAVQRVTAWGSFCQSLFAAAEFRYLN